MAQLQMAQLRMAQMQMAQLQMAQLRTAHLRTAQMAAPAAKKHRNVIVFEFRPVNYNATSTGAMRMKSLRSGSAIAPAWAVSGLATRVRRH
jgi:uncharacterized protein YjbI with pentapeptide repeats